MYPIRLYELKKISHKKTKRGKKCLRPSDKRFYFVFFLVFVCFLFNLKIRLFSEYRFA